VRFIFTIYRGRAGDLIAGTSQNWIKELKLDVYADRLSYRRWLSYGRAQAPQTRRILIMASGDTRSNPPQPGSPT